MSGWLALMRRDCCIIGVCCGAITLGGAAVFMERPLYRALLCQRLRGGCGKSFLILFVTSFKTAGSSFVTARRLSNIFRSVIRCSRSERRIHPLPFAGAEHPREGRGLAQSHGALALIGDEVFRQRLAGDGKRRKRAGGIFHRPRPCGT